MDLFKIIEDMHQQVREYVEKQFPAYKVMHISAISTTDYVPVRTKTQPPTKEEVVGLLLDKYKDMETGSKLTLQEIQLSFQVEAGYSTHRLSCVVDVTSDGELTIMRRPQVTI
jgi:hypothetical protein